MTNIDSEGWEIPEGFFDLPKVKELLLFPSGRGALLTYIKTLVTGHDSHSSMPDDRLLLQWAGLMER